VLTQLDVAHLSDDALARLVVALAPLATGDGPWVRLALRFGCDLVAVKRERRRAALILEADAMNDNGPGLVLADSNATPDANGGGLRRIVAVRPEMTSFAPSSAS
jgi:hypothetical protein